MPNTALAKTKPTPPPLTHTQRARLSLFTFHTCNISNDRTMIFQKDQFLSLTLTGGVGVSNFSTTKELILGHQDHSVAEQITKMLQLVTICHHDINLSSLLKDLVTNYLEENILFLN